jgi:hypothetical protein
MSEMSTRRVDSRVGSPDEIIVFQAPLDSVCRSNSGQKSIRIPSSRGPNLGSLSFDFMRSRFPEMRYQEIDELTYVKEFLINFASTEMRSRNRVVSQECKIPVEPAGENRFETCRSTLMPRSIVRTVEMYLPPTGTCRTIQCLMCHGSRIWRNLITFQFDFIHAHGTYQRE